jgi:hypothetical protein
MSYDECCGYFITKFNQWNDEGNIEPYVSNKGADTIYQDFKQDSTFMMIVCKYISQFPEDRKSIILREIINSVIAPTIAANTSSTFIDTLVVAALKACGGEKQGNDLLKALVWGTVIIASIGIGLSIWNRRRSRESKE